MKDSSPNLRDFCQAKRCRDASDVVYRGVGICSEHWHVPENSSTDEYLAKILCPEAKDTLLASIRVDAKQEQRSRRRRIIP